MHKPLLILFYCILLLGAQASNAQKIRFTDTSNVWRIESTFYGGPIITTYGSMKLSFIKDTVNGRIYLGPEAMYIREDTVANRIYCRGPLPTGRQGTFVKEELLYDFNSKLGDSIWHRYEKDSFCHVVTKLDSVSISGSWYKVWELTNIIHTPPATGIGLYPYFVVENIGCLWTGLLFPVEPDYAFERGERVVCFKNSGSIITIANPLWSTPGNFVDAKSCMLSANTVSKAAIISIIPNPANETSIIRLPYNMHSGKLVIVNALGQTVLQKEVADQTELPIGDLRLPGIYFYRVTDNETNQTFTGKFIYQ